ncbi:glycosyltransferase [Alkalimarinus sediminis]|uniref:Glycosyltransferase n=1 Tax=Alkalimarinus sediminis TaxID=1632866 RepID=A0A9E8KIM0_9ALTE|nr:glycosyltransferase [Alkalimarinus sediminis]UZW74061.1 glycosyltransferase [Alkalimarinus sediminis]
MTSDTKKRILWWGRHGNYGPNYPRNRTIIKCLKNLGHEIIEYQPRLSQLAGLEASFHDFDNIDLVWVPCFRQRDLSSASRWAKKRNISVVFDPLISAYDKRVHEKKKYPAGSSRAKRLLRWEQGLFAKADTVIADTSSHKQYFIDQLGCTEDKVVVIPVSAEEELFYPKETAKNDHPEVLFFGTFIGLQGPVYIAESIKHYSGSPITLTFLGDGPERKQCEAICQSINNPNVNVQFEDWIPFHDLPDRIRQSDICLGVFGTGEKSFRVIPNKVYQALACGRPVITMKGDAYPAFDTQSNHEIYFCQAGDPESIANRIKEVVEDKNSTATGASIYKQYFSNELVTQTLQKILASSKSAK